MSRTCAILHATFAAISSAFRLCPITFVPCLMFRGATAGARRTICLIRLARTWSTAFSGVRRVFLFGPTIRIYFENENPFLCSRKKSRITSSVLRRVHVIGKIRAELHYSKLLSCDFHRARRTQASESLLCITKSTVGYIC